MIIFLKSVNKKISKLNSLKHKIEANKSILDKEINFFDHNDSCPTCYQVIDNQFKCDIVNSKKNNIKEIFSDFEILKLEEDIGTNKLVYLKARKGLDFNEKDISDYSIQSVLKNG